MATIDVTTAATTITLTPGADVINVPYSWVLGRATTTTYHIAGFDPANDHFNVTGMPSNIKLQFNEAFVFTGDQLIFDGNASPWYFWGVTGGASPMYKVRFFFDQGESTFREPSSVLVWRDGQSPDSTPPAQPVIGTVAGDDVINAAEAAAGVTLTGTTEAGSTVALGIAGQSRAAAVTGTSWSYVLSAGDLQSMGEGAEIVTATATDAAGNISTAASHALTVDTTAPLLPGFDAVGGDSFINAGEMAAGVTIGGTTEVGSTVRVSIAGHSGDATVTGTTWSYTVPEGDLLALSEGPHTAYATATDAAGNSSPRAAAIYRTDTNAPQAPGGLLLDPGSDTGVPGDNITTAAAPTVTGTVEAGALVTLYDTDGTTVLGNTTALRDGSWSITSTTLSLGNHTLTALATDEAGNASGPSSALTLDIVAADLPPVYVSASGGSGQIVTSLYAGPVPYLQYEFAGSPGGEAVAATTGNDYINLQGGDDAADGGAGDDVLDGGTGSNFLTGGPGQDIFSLDGRGGETAWSTITDWDQGEKLALWGWRSGTSKSTWAEDEGTAGYKGATLHADLDGDGDVETSVTWTGLTRADLPTPTEQDGFLWFA
jgi:hypothetical protein